MNLREVVRQCDPFFQRLRLLHQVFAILEGSEHYRKGTIQDCAVEESFRIGKNRCDADDPEAVIDYKLETFELQGIFRSVAIVTLYATLESLCKGSFSSVYGRAGKVKTPVESSWVKKARKVKRKNFLLALLEVAEAEGMQSDIWPERRDFMEVFVALRHHFVHEGIHVTEELRNTLRPMVGAISEFRGDTPAEKLLNLGESGLPIRLPFAFVYASLDVVEGLALHLLVPRNCGSSDEPPSYDDIFGGG